MGGSYSAPYRITFSPLLAANSGQPFNIITGTDLNGDGILTNARPAFADCSSTSTTVVKTATHGCYETNPAPGQARIPINHGTGPAQFAFNLRVTKTIGFGRDTRTKATTDAGNAPPSGPPGGGRGGPGGPGGGGGRGGPGGGPFGGSPSSGRRFSLSLGVAASNLFNNVDRGVPNGVVGSPQFYQSTSLAGNPFTSNSAVRRISLTASFSF